MPQPRPGPGQGRGAPPGLPLLGRARGRSEKQQSNNASRAPTGPCLPQPRTNRPSPPRPGAAASSSRCASARPRAGPRTLPGWAPRTAHTARCPPLPPGQLLLSPGTATSRGTAGHCHLLLPPPPATATATAVATTTCHHDCRCHRHCHTQPGSTPEPHCTFCPGRGTASPLSLQA